MFNATNTRNFGIPDGRITPPLPQREGGGRGRAARGTGAGAGSRRIRRFPTKPAAFGHASDARLHREGVTLDDLEVRGGPGSRRRRRGHDRARRPPPSRTRPPAQIKAPRPGRSRGTRRPRGGDRAQQALHRGRPGSAAEARGHEAGCTWPGGTARKKGPGSGPRARARWAELLRQENENSTGQTARSPVATVRPLLVEEVAGVIRPSGIPKLRVLVALNISRRNCRFCPRGRCRVVLDDPEVDQVDAVGPQEVCAARATRWPGQVAEGFPQSCLNRLAPPASRSRLWSMLEKVQRRVEVRADAAPRARSMRPGPRWGPAPFRAEKGDPLWNVKVELTCQPPKILPRHALLAVPAPGQLVDELPARRCGRFVGRAALCRLPMSKESWATATSALETLKKISERCR